jgi:hypothetical protein
MYGMTQTQITNNKPVTNLWPKGTHLFHDVYDLFILSV